MILLKRLTGMWKAPASRAVQWDAPIGSPPKPPAIEGHNGDLPSFRLTAGGQFNPQLKDELADVRGRLRNAFTPSQPVNDRNLFAGRKALLAAVIRAIEDERRHVVIYGQRGIGKTSVMHILAQAATEARYRLAYVSCGVGSNFDETIRLISQRLPLLFHSAYGPTSPESEKGATFADLLGESEVNPRLAADQLAKLTGTRLIVMLDEFDRVESANFRSSIAEFIKNLSDRLVGVQLVIAGVAANLTELLAYAPSIQRGLFAVEAPPMPEDEIRLLVELGGRAGGVTFDEAAVDGVVAVADGSPYLASLLSHHAALGALDDGRLGVTSTDLSAALERALGEFENRIPKPLRDGLGGLMGGGQVRALGALAKRAQLDHGEFSIDVPSSAAIESAERRRSLVDRLAAEGLLTELGGSEAQMRFRFVDESLPTYLWLAAAKSQIEASQGGPHFARDRAALG